MRRIVLTVLVLAVAAIAATAPGEENLLKNGGFEEGMKPWATRFGKDTDNYRIEGDAAEGARCASIHIDDSAPENLRDAAYVAYRSMPKEPGWYRMRLAMKSDMTAGQAGPALIAKLPGDKAERLAWHRDSNVIEATGKMPWTRAEFYYQVPQGATQVVCQLQCVKMRGSVWFDAVEVARVGEIEVRKAQTRLRNGDFEEGLEGWGLRHGEGPEYGIAEGEAAYEGKRAARISIDADSREPLKKAAYFSRLDLPLDPGYYRLTFAMRTQLEKGRAGVYMSCQLAEGKYEKLAEPGKDGVPVAAGTTDWKEYSFVYRVPEGGKRLPVQVQVWNALGTAWFDAFRIEVLSDEEGEKAMKEQDPQATAMRKAGAEKLGEPCRIVNARVGKFFTHPDTGADLLVVNSCTPGGGTGMLIDYATDEKKLVRFPEGVGGWDVVRTGPRTLLFESLGNLHLVPVDIATGRVIAEGVFDVPYPTQYAWRLDVDKEGWVYYGSYPSCHAYRYHPETGKSEDLGRMGGDDKSDGNLYVRHLAVNKDGWLIACAGVNEKKVTACNPATGEKVALEPPVPTWVYSVGGEVYGRLYLGRDENSKPMRKMVRFNSDTRLFEDVDFPTPDNLQWIDMAYGSCPERLVLQAEDYSWWVVEPGKAPRKIWDLDLRGGELVGIDAQDRVVGYRGQDYFVAQPLAQTLDLKPMADNPAPTGMHFLRADPKGGVTGGPNFGQTLFRFDPARDLLQNTPQVVDGGGEVYDGQWIDGKFYFMSYGGGTLAVWDPEAEWDQWEGKNPKVLAQFNRKDMGSLIRPQGGMVIGPKGRLYSGLSAAYGTYDGGIAEYDLATDTPRHWMASQFFGPQVSIGMVAGDARYLYGVTSNNFNGVKDLTKDLVFFMFDPEAEEMLFTHPIADQHRYAGVCVVPDTGRVWLIDRHGLHRFEPEARAFAEHLPWPKETDAPASVTDCDARGASAWMTAGKSMVRLDDGPKPSLRVLFDMDRTTHAVAAGADGRLYFTQEVELWAAPLKN